MIAEGNKTGGFAAAVEDSNLGMRAASAGDLAQAVQDTYCFYWAQDTPAVDRTRHLPDLHTHRSPGVEVAIVSQIAECNIPDRGWMLFLDRQAAVQGR